MKPARCIIAALAVAAATASAASAQETTLEVVAAASQYDLSGTGTERYVAIRGTAPFISIFRIEAGVGYMNYRSQGNDRIHIVLPEAQAQLDLLHGSIKPYVGAGVGVALSRAEGETDFDQTLSAAFGARIDIGNGWFSGAELRVRSIDPWVGSTGDWGIRLGRRF